MKKSIGKIIATYRKQKHMSQTELSEQLAQYGIHLTQKSISAWETENSEPSATTFMYVCIILGIPDVIEAFFDENPANPSAELNDEGKEKVLSYIDMLIHPVSYRKEHTVVPFAPTQKQQLTLRLFDTRVSAGTGNLLDTGFSTTMEVEEDEARNADFAVTITGDSMEPEYHDRDIVLVHQQETLESGEVGIFELNGNAYIKKFRNDRSGTSLISLNSKYSPIPVDLENDSFHIFGRVCGVLPQADR